MREEGAAPDELAPPGREGAAGIGKGPAILSKFMVSSFKMSVFDKARLSNQAARHDRHGISTTGRKWHQQ